MDEQLKIEIGRLLAKQASLQEDSDYYRMRCNEWENQARTLFQLARGLLGPAYVENAAMQDYLFCAGLVGKHEQRKHP